MVKLKFCGKNTKEEFVVDTEKEYPLVYFDVYMLEETKEYCKCCELRKNDMTFTNCKNQIIKEKWVKL